MADALLVGLAWHDLGHPNLGIDALTRANYLLLQNAAAEAGREVNAITLFGGFPSSAPTKDAELPRLTPGPRLRRRELIQPRKSELLRELRRSALVIDIGEGDSWSDIYGRSRFLYQSFTKTLCLTHRIPLVLAPQTIGPFDHPSTRVIADQVMNRCRAIYTRDHESTEYLESRPRIHAPRAEFVDVAFALPFQQMPPASTETSIGMNVSGLLYQGGYTSNNELGLKLDYKEFTHRLIERLLARPDTAVYLVPHVIWPEGNDSDTVILEELQSSYPALRRLPEYSDASRAKSLISGLDFMIAGRMHAAIAGLSSNVPTLAIAYSRKFNGLFDTLNYPYYIDGKVAMGTDQAVEIAMDYVDRRDQLRSAAVHANKEAQSRLAGYTTALARLLSELP